MNNQITAVSLVKLGDKITVAVEIEGTWVPVIHEVDCGGVTSHIVEAAGIQSAIARDRRGRSQQDWSDNPKPMFFE